MFSVQISHRLTYMWFTSKVQNMCSLNLLGIQFTDFLSLFRISPIYWVSLLCWQKRYHFLPLFSISDTCGAIYCNSSTACLPLSLFLCFQYACPSYILHSETWLTNLILGHCCTKCISASVSRYRWWVLKRSRKRPNLLSLFWRGKTLQYNIRHISQLSDTLTFLASIPFP